MACMQSVRLVALYLRTAESSFFFFLEENGLGAVVSSTHDVHTHTTHAKARQALFLVSSALSQVSFRLIFIRTHMCLFMINNGSVW